MELKLLTLTKNRKTSSLSPNFNNIHPYWSEKRGLTREKFEKLEDLRLPLTRNYGFCARCFSINIQNKENPYYTPREVKFERFFKSTKLCSLCEYEISGRKSDE